MMRPTFTETAMEVAVAWSRRATCARRQVGCVLLDRNGHVLSTGYNGPARGQRHCTDHPCPGAAAPSGTGLDLCEAVHAEANALLQCPDVEEIDVCVCTTAPCGECVKLLLNTGCRRIVFLHDYPHSHVSRERWLRGRPDAGWDQLEMP